MIRTFYRITLLFSIAAHGQTTNAEQAFFSQHPASHMPLPAKHRKAIIHKGDGLYRTRLGWIADGKPNFADHMRIEIWGCGAGCILTGLADLTTGSTYLFPQSLSTAGPGRRLKFELGSNAVHMVGYFNEKKPADRWYVWSGTYLKLARDIPLPERCFYPPEAAENLLPRAECNFQPPEEEIDGQAR